MPRFRDLTTFVLTDEQTDGQTDRTDCFTPCYACARGNNTTKPRPTAIDNRGKDWKCLPNLGHCVY